MGKMKRLSYLIAPLGLAACTAEPAVDNSIAANSHYVSLGSSFAAGAGIGEPKEGAPERCGRNVNNYASLLAADLQLNLDDNSCSGATTQHLLSAWNELPAQLDAVTSETRLVTITVGGNDLNYMGLLFSASCDPDRGMEFRGQTRPCPERVGLPEEETYTALETNLTAITQQIAEKAPDARIVYVQYVSLVPEQACDWTPLDETAQTEARELAERLAAITADVAQANGAEVLAADQLSQNHTTCDEDKWSIGYTYEDRDIAGAPWHPTAAGHAGIAAALSEMLKS